MRRAELCGFGVGTAVSGLNPRRQRGFRDAPKSLERQLHAARGVVVNASHDPQESAWIAKQIVPSVSVFSKRCRGSCPTPPI